MWDARDVWPRRRLADPTSGPSKAAREAGTVIWAQDLAGSGVTVNAIRPGGVTGMRGEAATWRGDLDTAEAAALCGQPP